MMILQQEKEREDSVLPVNKKEIKRKFKRLEITIAVRKTRKNYIKN